jgi:hypothetical protein
VHNASNELLGEPLASKVSEQQVDTFFVGGGSEKLQKKPIFGENLLLSKFAFW